MKRKSEERKREERGRNGTGPRLSVVVNVVAETRGGPWQAPVTAFVPQAAWKGGLGGSFRRNTLSSHTFSLEGRLRVLCVCVGGGTDCLLVPVCVTSYDEGSWDRVARRGGGAGRRGGHVLPAMPPESPPALLLPAGTEPERGQALGRHGAPRSERASDPVRVRGRGQANAAG